MTDYLGDVAAFLHSHKIDFFKGSLQGSACLAAQISLSRLSTFVASRNWSVCTEISTARLSAVALAYGSSGVGRGSFQRGGRSGEGIAARSGARAVDLVLGQVLSRKGVQGRAPGPEETARATRLHTAPGVRNCPRRHLRPEVFRFLVASK